MKTGKWNYTEDIQYRVVLVILHEVPETPMHWQNAFVGQQREVVEVTARGGSEVFYIDNYDGSGLKKIDQGGGPDSYSAHVAGFDLIGEVPEREWQEYDDALHAKSRGIVERWQKANHPEEYARMQALIHSLPASRFRGRV